MNTNRISRRELLKAAGVAALGLPTIVPAAVLGKNGAVAPSNRITLGHIGVGGEGTKNLRIMLTQPDARVLAIGEIDPQRRATACNTVNTAYKNSDCRPVADFRDILARQDIDAVVISTPDHWHVPMSLLALRAGKDVICEKPTLTIEEGRRLSDTVARLGRVFQTSTEDRSLFVYHRMAELVRNGRIGKLQRIIVGLPNQPTAPGDSAPQPVPPGFDYEMWLGPAPWEPYCAARTHFNFRWNYDYSGGILTDWGAHLLDTAQWGNDTERSGPVEVQGTGRRYNDGLWDTFFDFKLTYRYANGVELTVDTSGPAIRFEGSEGWIGNKGWIGPLEASSKEILNSHIGPEELHLDTCFAGEHRNFLDCVKSRKEPYFPAEIGHRCATVMHIGNAAMILGRKLRWDPVAETYPDDADARRLMSRAMRAPWRL